MKLESSLLAAWKRLMKVEMPTAVVLKHNDPFTSGIPDASVSLNVDSWIEFKAGERIKWANDLQWLTCQRLAKATGRCWVVFYREDDGQDDGRQTFIIKASDVDKRGNFNRCIAQADGFNHWLVTNFLRQIHAA